MEASHGMTTGPRLTRRGVLLAAAATAGAAAIGAVPARAFAAEPEQTTANGFPVVSTDDIRTFRIEGSDASVALLPGAVATVLLHVARRFHYEVDQLAAGEAVGHRTSVEAGEAYLTNALSGTAMALRPHAYPLGVTDGFFAPQLAAVRAIVDECGGVIRWGGDATGRAQEGFFAIDVRPGSAELTDLAARIDALNPILGQGAGATALPG